MGWFVGILIALALSGVGASIENGLKYIGDSIKTSNGYVYKCQDKQHWYDPDSCEWIKKCPTP